LRDRKTDRPDPESLLIAVGRVAKAEGISVYAVGGCVRDRLLGLGLSDVDFVVVGDGPKFAEKAKTAMAGHGFVVYEKFGTASFITSEHKLEFVTARRESYDADSRNPSVESTDLETDLSRRDFTVNAMAMSVNPDSFGEIIDPFDGRGISNGASCGRRSIRSARSRTIRSAFCARPDSPASWISPSTRPRWRRWLTNGKDSPSSHRNASPTSC
jgi:hypothetical protein